MSRPHQSMRRARHGVAVVACMAFAAIPAAAQAAPVDLGTVTPFVVLGGQAVTNTGPSVLNGSLGVAPGTALSGFGLPAVVNGATHDNDAVAAQAQLDLTTAYDAAAGQATTADLSTQDLGGMTLTPGAYNFSSAAQLTGPLILDAQGDASAQFVFKIGTQLTTAPASSVVLIGGASPCNVFWQVGSSATLGSTTAFQGNLMALSSISLQNAASVTGRLLARNGQVSLINNVLDGSACNTDTTTGSTFPAAAAATPGATTPAATTPAAATAPANSGAVATTPAAASAPANSGAGTRPVGRPTSHAGRATLRHTPRAACTAGFSASVRGRMIKRVVFRLDGRRIASRSRSPFQVFVPASPGAHRVTARVTFNDGTRARTLAFRYRACAAAVRHPRNGPAQFTG
jgi:hypothetical protein